MKHKRVTLFAGHYGSGKTNAAVNYAFALKNEGLEVTVADLDTVNPYFRTKDSEKDLAEAGIKLIASEFANSNVDLPALPAEMYNVVFDKSRYAVLDIGGDDRGAFALGRYTPSILEENDYAALLVINKYRPLTATAEDCIEIMREIEASSGIPFTGIVNNSNLGSATTAENVLDSVEYANEVSRIAGIPVVFTCAKPEICRELDGKIENLKPIRLYVRQSFDKKEE